MTFNLEPTLIDADEERKFLQDEMADRLVSRSAKVMRFLSEPKLMVPMPRVQPPLCPTCGLTVLCICRELPW